MLVGTPERKKPLGRLKHRWENNIRMDFQKRVRDCVYRNYLSEDRDVEGFCEHCNEHSSSIMCGDLLDKLSNH